MSYTTTLQRGSGPTYSSTAGTHPLIPETVSEGIIKDTTEQSAALTLFPKRTMSSQQQRMPVLASKPYAYFVSGDIGLKQTTGMSWANKFLDAEEIAVIVPVAEKLLDDSKYNIWSEVKPEIIEAIGVVLDAAIFFGYNKPSTWPASIVVAALAAGSTVTEGASTIDVAADINSVMAAVEADGFTVDGFFMRNSLKAQLRGLRDSQKGFLFDPVSGVANSVYKGTIYGEKAVASMSGIFEEEDAGTYGRASNSVKLIAGSWKHGMIGVRQDLTWKMLDQAVINDADGNIVFNLPQQDMIAMRVVARYAFQVPNPLTRMSPTESTRYPFAVLRDTA